MAVSHLLKRWDNLRETPKATAMNKITLATQTLFAELQQRCLDAEFDAVFDERGSFVTKSVKGQDYWYYQRKIAGNVVRLYAGPVRDPAVSNRVTFFGKIKADFGQRREIVRALLATGLPQPDPTTGIVIDAMTKAGFFRLRGVLIGTVAFQCYAGMLGVKLSGSTLMTQDADFAQFYDISRAVGDTMPPILDVLRKADPAFKPIPHLIDPVRVTRFRNDDNYLVEFLTPNRGSDDHMGRPALMPALGGASAQPLRYLDFLIRDPVRSVLLYQGGIPVTVAAPERYAIHKLIVAVMRRQDNAKPAKDIAQAQQLIEAMMTGRKLQLAEAWTDAWDRGPEWRRNLTMGASMLDDASRNGLASAVTEWTQLWKWEKEAQDHDSLAAAPDSKAPSAGPQTKRKRSMSKPPKGKV